MITHMHQHTNKPRLFDRCYAPYPSFTSRGSRPACYCWAWRREVRYL